MNGQGVNLHSVANRSNAKNYAQCGMFHNVQINGILSEARWIIEAKLPLKTRITKELLFDRWW